MTDPFEGMTPAEIYRSGYQAGKARALDDDWNDFAANVQADSRRLLDLMLERPWERAKPR